MYFERAKDIKININIIDKDGNSSIEKILKKK